LVALLVPLTKLIIAIGVVWVVFSMVDLLGEYIAGQQEVRLTKFDDLLIPFMRKFLKILVSAFAIVFIAQVFEKDITGLVATLGIGGLAVALAARDTLENFFGSITVLFDRPFQTGDWIVLGDVEGTVERVGFRSTRVRTFYNSLITIPNSRIVNSHVDNLGLRRYRRAKTVLSITYNTRPRRSTRSAKAFAS
jgi:MscS family membrane protein